MARYTKSRLGLIPTEDEGEFRHRYRFPTNAQGAADKIRSLFDPHDDAVSGHHSFIKPNTDGDTSAGYGKLDVVGGSTENPSGDYVQPNTKPPRDVIHTDPQFKSPLDFDALHSNGRYDLSTTNIVKELNRHSALRVKYSDFAYCKDFGNYPNNRLIIVRRFGGPVGDNLTRTGSRPIAKVVSWFDDSNPPISIDFGVNWQEAEANFKSVLNNMGNDIGLGKIGIDLGNVASGGFGLLPFPGAFEPFTRSILSSMGIISGSSTFIPSGSGTLIKEAKVRKLISDDQTGSSLAGKISVAVKCAWEQKFIGGIDPTPVYYDLLRSILHFGSDDASFYAGGGAGIMSAINKFLAFLQDPFRFVKILLEKFAAAFDTIKKKVIDSVNQYFEDQKVPKDTSAPDFKDKEGKVDEVAKAKYEEAEASKAERERVKANGVIDKAKKKLQKLVDFIAGGVKMIGKGMANKYRHVLMGIGAALTGAPSTPWHVTVGNPFRPILSSGDMYCEGSMKLTLGATLAFNDLPASIELDFTLTSARNLGANEIFRKLTTGEMRFSTPIRPNFYHEFEEDGTFKEADKNEGSSLAGDTPKTPDGRGSIEEDAEDGNLPFGLGTVNNPSNAGNSSNNQGSPAGATAGSPAGATAGSPAGATAGSPTNNALGNASGSSSGKAPAGGNGGAGNEINKDAASKDPAIKSAGAGSDQPGGTASNIQDQVNKGASPKANEPPNIFANSNPNPYKVGTVVDLQRYTLPELFPGPNAENIFNANSDATGEYKIYYSAVTGGGVRSNGTEIPWEPLYGIDIRIGKDKFTTVTSNAGVGKGDELLRSAKEEALRQLKDQLDLEFGY